MTHHLVMPFTRPANAQVYLRHLKDQGVVWHPLCASDVGLKEFSQARPTWVQPLFDLNYPKDAEGKALKNPCYWKLNQFIERTKPVDGDYYTIMTDDNFWHRMFWMALQSKMRENPPVIVCSQLRAHGRIPAMEQSMRAFLFDLSMLTLRGDALRDFRFDEQLWFADGVAAEQLLAKYDTKIAYAEQSLLYYNALTPEAWGYKSESVIA